MKSRYFILIVIFSRLNFFGQATFPSNGAPFNTHNTYAFINATIYVDYETVIKNGTLLIKDGIILTAAQNVTVPKHAVVYDLKGKFIYPAFIDLFSDFGIVENKSNLKHSHVGPQMESNVKGAYGWNQAIKADFESHKNYISNKEKSDDLKRAGFGTVLSCSKDGIVRGTGVLINLSNKKENENIVVDKAACFYSFSKGSSTQDYPSSLTGSIALLRQTFYDAVWYAQNGNKTEYNISLEAFNKIKELPSVFEVNDKYTALRAAKIGEEFNVNFIVKAAGNEYQRIKDIQNTNLKYILPLNFPVAYDVEDPFDAEAISLADLKHWELAPTNPAVFEKNNIPFCLTASNLKDNAQFFNNLRKAVKFGLSEKMALKALTVNPAVFINVKNKLGALKKDYYANFFISNKSIFESDAVIMESWVTGEQTVFSDIHSPDYRGNYELTFSDKKYKVKFSGEASAPQAKIMMDTIRKNFNYTFSNNLINFNFLIDSLNLLRASGNYNFGMKLFQGKVQLSDGNWSDFKMIFESTIDTISKIKKADKNENLNLGKVTYPFGAYGKTLADEQVDSKKPADNLLLIKNVNVWTNKTDSVLLNYDVQITQGKISKIGKNLTISDTSKNKIIDGMGRHLTPGIIDEHSHIALTAGVNEGTQASSAEVRMGDVINPEDINIYRQLSGGVTCAQLLHGSANPIGGQSVLIKLRWGNSAEGLKYNNADGFIKFALGENVKQSNWGDYNSVRFPQSRMGVEQVYNDYFTRAKEYDKQWKEYLKTNPKDAEKNKLNVPRKDLELEALAEILNKKRFITCHSYVQSEINMLMHVADTFGFKVNTFTHILEGYKVADKMKVHGVNASTFSDWWAYKNEVMEAIPQNAAILTKMGVNTSINSDDAEMARRLNQEAAKSVKYGGLTETEALKLVTLNPAKMLHIDDEVGSIEVGKTADLVLWSDNPLSVYAKAEKTIIDGKIYFDREQDEKLREEIKTERARIIKKLLQEKQKGGKVERVRSKQDRLYHCNTIEGVDEELTGHR